MKAKKIILVGAGAVGCSFLYSAMNRGLASEYGIIDVNKANVEGQTLDFEDGSAPSDYPFNVFPAEYSDCKDADLVVITAGRPQLPGETRLNMVEGNAKIMKEIATNIKQSGFKGITVIASNPVDILTLIYQEVTGFDKKTVIGSGTSLDSARLTREISKRINIAPQSIQAYVLGEHGDSSVSAFSVATVGGLPLSYFVKNKRIDESEFPKIHEFVWKKAYEIIERKRATFYGIGVNLANICENIIRDSRKVLAIGAFLEGQYKNSG
ncbi:MAG: L-lactate dehydrogenase, partial [Mycoplasmataceae bacterium]|nr:L-lactate dehydrogenase [Mycoplasmataceae bacterium]